MFGLQNHFGRKANNFEPAYELIRIFLGLAIFIRGILFISNQSLITNLAPDLDGAMVSLAGIHLIALVHLSGGFMLTVGFLTRIAALMQIPILAGAVFFVHLNEGLLVQSQSLELSIMVLFLLGLVFLFGGGRYSFDAAVLDKELEVLDQAQGRIQPENKLYKARVRRAIEMRRERVRQAANAMYVEDDQQDSSRSLSERFAEEKEKRLTIWGTGYTFAVFAGIFAIPVLLMATGIISWPIEFSTATIIGGSLMLIFLVSMVLMIYQNALSES